eukprot:10532202-Heterocapsa_arctica.AAC.1
MTKISASSLRRPDTYPNECGGHVNVARCHSQLKQDCPPRPVDVVLDLLHILSCRCVSEGVLAGLCSTVWAGRMLVLCPRSVRVASADIVVVETQASPNRFG